MRRLQWLLVVLGCTVVTMLLADDRGPDIPKGKGEQCVAETDFMRRDHMRLLIHQRDLTVLEGIRDEPFSLSECVDCHVQTSDSGEPIRIDADGQFCQSCHEYAAVKIDCFGCHAAVPDQAAATPDTQLPATGSSGSSGAFDVLSYTGLALYQSGKQQRNVIKD